MAQMATQIQVVKDGPLIVKGPCELKDAAGVPIPVKEPTVALCRCGQSAGKPFCDGSHKRAAFQG